MDYEEAYKEAIKRAKAMIKVANNQEETYNSVITIFPELKENEEEKVKRILHSIWDKMSFHLHDIFTEEEFQCFDAWSNAWLERCGKQKATKWSEEDENMVKDIIAAIDTLYYHGMVNWLKALKQRIGG